MRAVFTTKNGAVGERKQMLANLAEAKTRPLARFLVASASGTSDTSTAGPRPRFGISSG